MQINNAIIRSLELVLIKPTRFVIFEELRNFQSKKITTILL
jgi:hypothetical protein